jgi:hypothetical protein
MSKDKQKVILLGGLVLVFAIVVVNSFVLTDGGTTAPTTANTVTNQARRSSPGPTATQRARSQNRSQTDSEPAEGYRPLPLQALDRRRANAQDPRRNLFVYFVPPPPPPKMDPPPPPPPLTITSVRPPSAYAGQDEFTIEVSGVELPNDARIFLNSQPLTTTVESASQLKAVVKKSQVATPGQSGVTVRNQAGNLFSNQLALNVQDAPKPPYRSYVGRIDNLVFLARSDQDRESAFLGDVLDERWRVASVTNDNVTLEDLRIGRGIQHVIAIAKSANLATTIGPGGQEVPSDSFNQSFFDGRGRRFRQQSDEADEDEEPQNPPPQQPTRPPR